MENENTNSAAVTETTGTTANVPEDGFLAAFGDYDGKGYTLPEEVYDMNTDDDADDDDGNDGKAAAPDKDGKEKSETKAEKTDGEDYVIRYKGKEETLHRTRDELIADLQKARDYDAVRAERDALRKASNESKGDREIMEHFARSNGMSLAEYRNYMKTQTADESILNSLREKYGEMSDAAAQALLEAERAKRKAEEDAEADKAAAAEIEAAKAEYPDMDINALPSGVQADIADGMKLIDALRANEIREARKTIAELNKQIDALKKTKDVHARNAGSMYSHASDNGVDAFVRGFTGGGY